MYEQLIKDNDENVIFSPLSLSIAVAQLYIGSEGKTREEIGKTFYFQGENEEFLANYEAFINNFDTNSNHNNLQMSIANSICINEIFVIDKNFEKSLKSHFDSDFYSFAKYNDAVDIVNDWVNKKTNKKINQLLSYDEMNVSTQILLNNVVYFKAAWEDAFEEKKTKKDKFFLSDSGFVKTDFMKINGRRLHVQIGKDWLFRLPYKDGKYEMLLILPYETDGIKRIEREINNLDLEKILSRTGISEFELSLPKFTALTEKDNINSELKRMGIQSAFSDSANLSPICEEKYCDLKVGSVGHKAVIEVNESGTEAAAVTTIKLNYFTGVPDELIIKFDHPFLYFIYENRSNTILFMGRCMNPVQ